MAWRIKNYARFQHFKDRRPPWIKLYRDLLDDPDWHSLDAVPAKVLTMLWLIASEDESKQGNLPDNRHLCFRLRINEKELEHAFSKLSHWLEHDNTSLISDRYQVDAPETETEAETEYRSPLASGVVNDGFATFWNAYPKKVGKGAAEKAWKKLKPALSSVLQAIERMRATEQWRKDNGQFIPNPATWLNQRRWEDDEPEIFIGAGAAYSRPPTPGDKRMRHGVEEVFTDCAGWVPA